MNHPIIWTYACPSCNHAWESEDTARVVCQDTRSTCPQCGRTAVRPKSSRLMHADWALYLEELDFVLASLKRDNIKPSISVLVRLLNCEPTWVSCKPEALTHDQLLRFELIVIDANAPNGARWKKIYVPRQLSAVVLTDEGDPIPRPKVSGTQYPRPVTPVEAKLASALEDVLLWYGDGEPVQATEGMPTDVYDNANVALRLHLGLPLFDGQPPKAKMSPSSPPTGVDGSQAAKDSRSEQEAIAHALRELKERGLTFSDCVEAFGVPASDPVAQEAINQYAEEGRIEIDSTTVLSESDRGSYVMAWVWVEGSDEEAEDD